MAVGLTSLLCLALVTCGCHGQLSREMRLKTERQQKAAETSADNVIQALLANYDPLIAPRGTTGPINVTIQLYPVYILGLDLKTQLPVFSLQAGQRLVWKDNRLKWKDWAPSVKTVHIPMEKLWTPDINLLNRVGPKKHYEKTRVVVKNDGKCDLEVERIFNVPCSAGGKNVTTGTRVRCSLSFGSWEYYEDRLKLMPHGASANHSYYHDVNSVWKLVGTGTRRTSSHYKGTMYDIVNFDLDLQHK